jgi:hypothetical protein
LFEDYQERRYNQMVFEAGLQGVNLKEVSEKDEGKPKASGVFEFKSPEEYERMSEEERQELTKKMMGTHKLKFG